MSDRVFLDTNVLIYFYSENEKHKRDITCRLLNRHNCVTSIQALNEACNVWGKKCGWNGKEIEKHLDNLELVCDGIVPVQRATVNKALELKDSYGYSYYDCLMLASALENGCDTIFTEDMSDGQIIESSLEIVNIFTRPDFTVDAGK